MAFMAFGKAASELVVANAIETGSLTAFIKRFTGIFKNKAIGSRIPPKKSNKARYRLPSSIKRFLRISTPRCPTVYAMAAPTPIGAKSITIFVNLNIASERLSVKLTNGFRFFSSTNANPIPNITPNTTIWSTWFSYTALTIFSGKVSRINALNLYTPWTLFDICDIAALSATLVVAVFGSSSCGIFSTSTPTPAWVILMTINPINIAQVVADTKYSIDFHAIRPTDFKSECPAIPKTNVANRMGPTMVFTNLIKACDKGCKARAKFGKSSPIKTPRTKQVNIQVVKFLRTIAFSVKTEATIHRTHIMKSGWIANQLNSYIKVRRRATETVKRVITATCFFNI